MGKIPHKEKLERREDAHLHLKGERCLSPKCGVTRRNYPPGVHGPKGKRRQTPFGQQLREKQKAKVFYGILERQFRRYFDEAIRKKGDTGVFLLQALETRLDNMVYRMSFATSRRQARQMVNHRHFLVNGVPTNIPSFAVRVGDVITLKETRRNSPLYASFAERVKKSELPAWLTVNADTFEGKMIAVPETAEITQIFDPKLIIEFYSR